MSPKTDRIAELYNDDNRRAHEMLVHARKMEDGLSGWQSDIQCRGHWEAQRKYGQQTQPTNDPSSATGRK